MRRCLFPLFALALAAGTLLGVQPPGTPAGPAPGTAPGTPTGSRGPAVWRADDVPKPVPRAALRPGAEWTLFSARADAPKAEAPKAKPNPKWKTITAKNGTKFRLVARDQLRIKNPRTHTLTLPRHLRGVMKDVPAPPPTADWTRGNTLSFPVLGNDRYGDCYAAAISHQVQTWTGNVGTEATFDPRAVVDRYLQLSGGDNGLSDTDVYGSNHDGEWYTGWIGPAGPHKILDHMTVNPSDARAVQLAIAKFGGVVYTCALLTAWEQNVQPGTTWDAGLPVDPDAGHAIILNGYDAASGTYALQTWGLNPPVALTQAGLVAADPEVVVQFSLDWFNAAGKSPNGDSYDDLAALWQTLGGRQLPPSPFAPPSPPAPPAPPAPPQPPAPPVPAGAFTGTLTYQNGVLVAVSPGVRPGTVADDLRAAGVSAEVIVDVLQLIGDLKAKADIGTIAADVLKIITDLGASDAAKKFGRREDPHP